MKDNHHKEILRIAVPSIVSNITVPLLGLVDITIVGHLGAASYIGAIAIGSTIFSMIYWIFAFFRMGTSGMTSQAYGANNLKEAQLLLFRSVISSLGIAVLILIFQKSLLELALLIMAPADAVKTSAVLYFNICIWGAPAMLILYSITGWLLGMQNAKYPLYIAIVQNLVNILASIFFVIYLKMNVSGVAFGTLIAQYLGLIMASILCTKVLHSRQLKIKFNLSEVIKGKSLQKFFTVNRDIFLRTLCLVCVTLYFTAAGSHQSVNILATNALLMQFFTLYSYFMDGFAFAGEALSGKHLGAKNGRSLDNVVKALFIWGCGVSVLFTLIYAIGGNTIISLFTNEQNVRATASEYIYWVVCIPFAGLSAFIWDGIFIGLTATRQMLTSMFCAMCIFFTTYLGLNNSIHNHALWLAFILYLLTRGIMQGWLYKNKIIPLHRKNFNLIKT